MDYTLVYDAAAESFPWAVMLSGAGAVAIGLILVISNYGVRGGILGPANQPWFRWTYLVLALVWTSVASAATVSSFVEFRDASRDGSCRVVEGVVANFVPMPYEGHAQETFSVAGAHFSISDFVLNAGFNNTASHGGPLREALPVRICYLPKEGQNIIVRLEVAK